MTERSIVQAGRLLDVVAGELLPDRRILVTDGRIEAVLAPGESAPDDARPIDLGRLTVLPGLIDCHSHLVGDVQVAGVPSTTTSPAEEALIGVRNARRTLAAGFTAVRDVGGFRAFVDCALRDAIAAGHVEGPRMQCAGAFITAPWGGGDVVGLARDIRLPDDLRFGVVRGPEEVRDRVRRLMIGGADLVKCIATGAVLTRGGVPGAPELTEDELRAAVEEAGWYGAFVAAHAHGDVGAKRAIRAGVRSIEHGSILDDEALAMMAERGTYLVMDVYDGYWIEEAGPREGWPEETLRKNRETMATAEGVLRKAIELGVRLAYGTDSGVYPHGLNGRQFACLVEWGLSPLAAIRSATVWAAEMMGWGDRLGAIGPRLAADLIGVEGDPLAEPSLLEDVRFVMQAGRVVRGPETPATGGIPA